MTTSGRDASQAKVHEDDKSLVSILVSHRFRNEKFLRHDNHADVYAVYRPPSQSEEFEARVYQVEGVSPKLRRHRLRNIKRLSNRTVLEDGWEGKIVVVYKVNSETCEDQEDSGYKESLPVQTQHREESNLTSKTIQTKQKTNLNDRQRETARVRQLERRQTKRRIKWQNKGSKAPEGDSPKLDKTGTAAPRETTNENDFYALLYVACEDPFVNFLYRSQISKESEVAIDHYLRKCDLKFEDVDELEAFMKAKQSEVLFLQREQLKLPEVLRRRHDEFERLLKKQARHRKNSRKYLEMQQPAVIAHHRLKSVRYARDILPRLIEENDKAYRDLRRRLPLALQKKEELETSRAIHFEWENLKRKVEVYDRCSHTVVPASGPYCQLLSQVVAAEKDLRDFEMRHSKTLFLSLESLQIEYQNIIGSAGKKSPISILGPCYEWSQKLDNTE